MSESKSTYDLLPSIYQNFTNGFNLNDSMESALAPLIVNCAGCHSSDKYFFTNRPQGRDDFYLLYMLEGKLKVKWQDSDFSELKPGSFFFIPPHTPYRYYPSGDNFHLKYLWVHFTGSYAKDVFKQYKISPPPCIYNFELSPDAVIRFQNLFSAFNKNEIFLEAVLASHLDSVLRTLARTVMQTERPENLKIHRSVSYINTHYHTDLKVPELAKMEFLSISHYITVFKKNMGMPPSQYIIKVRINAACTLLQESGYSIKEIGSMVGYDESHYFYYLFKKHMGVSPGEYRAFSGNV